MREIGEGRQAEANSLSRILRGLSRSVSPDAIVDAIVEDLGEATAADHAVVVRLRPERQALEATLVSSRAGVPSSTTLLPLSDLEDPGPGGLATAVEPSASRSARIGARSDARRRDAARRRGAAPGRRTARRPAVLMPLDARQRRGARRGPVASHAATLRPARRRRCRSDRGSRADRRSRGRGLRPAQHGPGAHCARTMRSSARSSSRAGCPRPGARRRSGSLDDAAAEASAALGRAYSHRAAEARAATDALTGLPNRRYFDEFCGLLARASARRRRGRRA